ncbi:hypothetical protein MNBD_GAMMA16-220 [hydrothermal vent metagenome]|uniref:Uncharacterized protein n=1 Tax=hydrothermal vent metagenome TaxID=652676 RepID=A0A3B0Z4Y5_9ZZZZ
MDPDKLMTGLSTEILAALNAMKDAKTAEEKLTYSATVKNLCESLGVFLKLMDSMELYDDDDDITPF